MIYTYDVQDIWHLALPASVVENASQEIIALLRSLGKQPQVVDGEG